MKNVLDMMIDKATGYDKVIAKNTILESFNNPEFTLTIDARKDEDHLEWINDENCGLCDYFPIIVGELNKKPNIVNCILHIAKLDFTKWRNRIEISDLPYAEEFGMFCYGKFGINQFLFIKADEVIKNEQTN